jgi:hypothetical protein
MPLHRDIYWVGKQWAVTGYGIQACDQKQKSKFDIEAIRLWEAGALESVRAERWLNIEDFEKALAVARKRFPEPPRQEVAPKRNVMDPIETVLKETNLKEVDLKAAGLTKSPMEQPKPMVQKFDMRIENWPAKFVPQWRVRIRR